MLSKSTTKGTSKAMGEVPGTVPEVNPSLNQFLQISVGFRFLSGNQMMMKIPLLSSTTTVMNRSMEIDSTRIRGTAVDSIRTMVLAGYSTDLQAFKTFASK